MLIGQAPGLREDETEKPFHGQAGQGIRKVFEDIGISDFDEFVWSSAVVKCYPGRKLVKSKRQQGFRSVDEIPPASMVKNCQPFLMRQIELAEPKIMR
ncbi:MAG: uracil-DNA glycosylase family protein [Deltaproteobacteria bacterium]|nr:uracil-DNA glycosylase family protein [Deltaproteobacteria bacterium]